ncbi:hypothetical protein J2S55_008678 [Streptosporangium brasiliense]|uniref:Uncharacterized protein n=1 Tax=Streptosporangium brasiliense TaxID=47480 RepID=A0ABT9RJE0_9ACTN|nr:hypothetical protein [Streptosporangium brasiliense]
MSPAEHPPLLVGHVDGGLAKLLDELLDVLC